MKIYVAAGIFLLALVANPPLCVATPKTESAKKSGAKPASKDLTTKESSDLNERGVNQIKARDFISAEDSFRKALAADPNNITAAFNYGSALLINKKEAAALKLLTEYVSKEPADAGLRARLGDAYFGTKDVKQASIAYEEAYRLDPTFPEILSKLSTVYLLTNRTADAEKYLALAAEQNPRDAKLLANLSSLYLGNGKPELAIAAAKKSLQLQATKEVYITLATAYEILKDYKNSIIAFQRAVDLGDNREEVLKKIEGLKKVTS